MAGSPGRLTRIVTVVGAVAGLAGYVFVIGGIVVWLRADHAGLPGDLVVASTPSSDLLAVGLLFLWQGVVTAASAALVAVVVGVMLLVIGALQGRARIAVIVGLAALVLAAVIFAILDWAITTATVVGGALLYALASFALSRGGRRPALPPQAQPVPRAVATSAILARCRLRADHRFIRHGYRFCAQRGRASEAAPGTRRPNRWSLRGRAVCHTKPGRGSHRDPPCKPPFPSAQFSSRCPPARLGKRDALGQGRS